MKKVGFKYQPRKKSYYIDTHDSPENIEYRKEFIQRYLEYELLFHQWYPISAEERNEMVEKGEVSIHMGYEYEKDGCTFFEFHVDYHEKFQIACKDVEFGGHLSVRKPQDKRKIMMMGQDEAIMRQKLFTLLAWCLSDVTTSLLPKDDGVGLMISAFTSRELGFGFTVNDKVLEEVNLKRKNTK